MDARWFSEAEIEGLDPRLVEMLDRARGLAKTPFRITSGRRSADQNQQAGGVMDSAHTRGLAVDLGCFDSRARMRMLSGLIVAGFRRIGCYDRHLHADIDETLPQDVLWVGQSH
jgi:zinc D-Ala-D-Ala carboxypeptidase